ncbi:hypothetical protein [Nostoc commune]|uniref:hypothetical protein n=1 Tax=Nostoc commune TaxID=1178 RepID=UPI0020737E65|nr:hypothetical protein [Nostoc commune]
MPVSGRLLPLSWEGGVLPNGKLPGRLLLPPDVLRQMRHQQRGCRYHQMRYR